MMKKIYDRLAVAVLLVLTLVAMLGTVVSAVGTDSYLLQVDYNGLPCTVKYKVTVGGAEGAEKTLVPGTPVSIPKIHDTVELIIEPNKGYRIAALKNSRGGTVSLDRSEDNDTVSYKAALNADSVFTPVCEEKPYTFDVQSAAEGGHWFAEGKTDPSTLTYVFTQSVQLAVPSLEGYVFEGWLVLPTRDAEVGTLLSPQVGQDYVNFSDAYVPNSGNVIYLKPQWGRGEKQPVYRYDRDYQTGGLLSDTPVQWEAFVGNPYSGCDGDTDGYKSYLGYYPFDPNDTRYFEGPFTVQFDTEQNPENPRNKVNRYYLPIEYTLVYQDDDKNELEVDASYPTSYVYNHASDEIPQPTRVGYEFAGWQVIIINEAGEEIDVTNKVNAEVTVIKRLAFSAKEAGVAEDNAQDMIILRATWVPNKYDVVLDYNHSDLPTETLENAYNYETGATLPNPERTGYEFAGWELPDGTVLEPTPEAGTTVIPEKTFIDTINLVAKWTPKSFTVTLDGNGADSTDHTASLGVTFDSALVLPDDFKLPTRIGHTFVGYYLTDADGKNFLITVTENGDGSLTAKSEVTQWKIDGDTTLIAEWSINSYLIEVEIDDENAEVVITDEDGNGRYDYNEQITVTVTALNNHKLVQWCGSAIEHRAVFTWRFQMGAEDCLLTGIVLPTIASPSFEVDYIKELITTDLSLIPDGRYQIVCEGQEPLNLVVRNGKISVNGGDAQDVLVIPEAYYGKTVQILTYGVFEESADSDWYALTVNPRPAMPEMNTPNAEIGHVYQHEETKIVVEMTNLDTLSRFEFACSENSDGKGLTWWNVQNCDERYFVLAEDGKLMFVNLKPGTTYHVYVRVRAVADDHAHGVENRIEVSTYSDNTLEAKKNALLDLIKDSDGEMVKNLIDRAIQDANALVSPSPSFYDELEAIYARVLAGIEFARVQDAKIAELKALQTKLIASGEFSTANVSLINNICEVAVQTIKSATAIDVVQIAYESGISQMKAIPVTHLTCGDMELTAKDGLEQGTLLSQDRLTNVDDITAAVNTAIQTGKFVYGGTAMTQAQVAEALKSLDVMAAYQMRLTDSANAMLAPNGTFEVRLLLPEDLRNVSGLQVAFYNDKTGELEVLDTEKDGNCLVFHSTRVGDFVILGDPTMNLTGFIIALGLILACQLVGVILLMVRRVKYAKNLMRHNSMILPTVMLTIRFLPQNGVTILAVLGGLVVLFQIILMYLLLSSEVVYRQKRDSVRHEGSHAADVAVMADADVEEYTEAEEIPEEEELADVTEDGWEEASEETVEADADFIEPAANPYYSLPEEELQDSELDDVFAENVAEELTEDSEEAYEEYADASEDAVPAWEYSDEETEDADEEASEWTEETAEWQYDDELAEDAESDAEQAFDTEGYDTEVYAESDYEDAEEAAYDEDAAEAEYSEDADGYVKEADGYAEESDEIYDGEETYDEEISEEAYDEEAYEDEAYAEDDEEEAPLDDEEWSYAEDDEEPKQYDGYEE